MNSPSTESVTPAIDGGSPSITAIVPARNEEDSIAACLESLAKQIQMAEIFVVDDESRDNTAQIVRHLAERMPTLRLLAADPLPQGVVGKNNALATGARHANSPWLLFVDADVVLEDGAAASALQIANDKGVALVSFSPDQVTVNWYEKALIPFVYCRLARRFSFDEINDPQSKAAAANGQFLLIRRDVYNAVGGHRRFAGDVLEDVALASAVKAAGHRIWFGPGKGIVSARMYRSFASMWEGWRKNLFRLVGGTSWAAFREAESTFPWMAFLVILIGLKVPGFLLVGIFLILLRQIAYGADLVRNQYPFGFIIYYIPAVFLYTAALWASYRAHAIGRVRWKGREYRSQPTGGTGTR